MEKKIYTGCRKYVTGLCSSHAFITSDDTTGLSANAVLPQQHNPRPLNISQDVCGEDEIVQHSRKAACLWNPLRPITSLSPCPIWIQVARTHGRL